MKNRVLFLLLLCAALGSKANLIDAKSLKGPWREVQRMQKGQSVFYRDTLFFELLSSNLCVWGKTSPSAPRLKVKLTGTTLELGSFEFDILDLEGDKMRLLNAEGQEITMQRYSKKAPVVRNTNNKKFVPSTQYKMGTVPDKIEPFVGNWKCYKRTSNKPIAADQKYRLVRLVEIEEIGEVITAKIYGFDDLATQPSWIVQNYENGILYTAGKDERLFKVINCQANELVLENEGVVYYMNRL